MLYQDTLTGMLHEVPDSQVYGLGEDPYSVGEAQMVYDGLGNPLGWGFLKKLVKKAVPFATSMLGPYGQIIKTALPVVQRALAPSVRAMRQQAAQQLARAPMQAQPQLEGLPIAYPRPGAYSPMAMRPPVPPTWSRPQLPYTGPQPRRLYLRCSSWRGPSGLVPANAVAPGIAPPPAAIAAQTAAARVAMRRRARGRRR